jgi:tetratricopeptide (TPR) repeat protein
MVASLTKFCALLAVALIVVAIPAIASGQSDDIMNRVMLLDQEAGEHFQGEEYEEAFLKLQAAQVLAPAAPRLFNMAVCQERIGHLEEALDLFEQYLEGDHETINRVEDARARIEAIREELNFDDDGGHDEAPLPPEETTGHRLSPPAFYSSLAVTAVAGVATIVLGAITLAQHNDFETRFSDESGYGDAQSRGQALAISTDVLLGTTLVAAAVTVVLALLTEWSRTPSHVAVGSRAF